MILDRFDLGEKHKLKGGYLSRKEVSKFGYAQYEMEFTKEELEALLEKRDGLSIVYHFVKYGLESVMTVRDKINKDFEDFYNDYYNQKKINEERLLNLPVDGEFKYLDISNKSIIAKMTEDYSFKDVEVSESTFLNYGRLYFDKNNILKKLIVIEGISHSKALMERIEERYDKLGFKKNYDGELKGMFGLRTELIPKKVIQFDGGFLQAFHSYSIYRESIFSIRDSTQKEFFTIESNKYPVAEKELEELGIKKEKYNVKMLSTEIRRLMSGNGVNYKDTARPLRFIHSSDEASSKVLVDGESNKKNVTLNLYYTLRELVKRKGVKNKYEIYLENIRKNYQPK